MASHTSTYLISSRARGFAIDKLARHTCDLISRAQHPLLNSLPQGILQFFSRAEVDDTSSKADDSEDEVWDDESEAEELLDTFFRGDAPFRLLDLPGELRNKIYAAAWDLARKNQCQFGADFVVSSEGFGKGQRKGYMFFLLNKKVRREARSIVYPDASLKISLLFGDDYFDDDVDPLGEVLSALKKNPLVYDLVPYLMVELNMCEVLHRYIANSTVVRRQQTFEILERLIAEMNKFIELDWVLVRLNTCQVTSYQADFLLAFCTWRDEQGCCDVMFEFQQHIEDDEDRWIEYIEDENNMLCRRRARYELQVSM